MISETKRKDILLLYKAGKTLREIEEMTGCVQSTIMRIIKSNKKIKLRGEHCSRINRAKLKNLPEDYMSRKHSIKELLKKYGIKSEQTLYRILDEFKVPRQRQMIKPDI
jgi:hypothetical protein